MKKYVIVGLTMILAVTMLVGCGCTRQDMTPATIPTTTPVPSTAATVPTTRVTTAPTTPATTVPHGNGALETTTAMTENPASGTASTSSTTGSK